MKQDTSLFLPLELFLKQSLHHRPRKGNETCHFLVIMDVRHNDISKVHKHFKVMNCLYMWQIFNQPQKKFVVSKDRHIKEEQFSQALIRVKSTAVKTLFIVQSS